MDNRYELKDRLLLLEQGKYNGCWYRIISYGRFPGVFVAPNVHSEFYGNTEKCIDLIAEMHGAEGRYLDKGGIPDAQSQLNPQYTEDGNVAWWCGWAYNGKHDYMAGQYHPGRQWTTEDMVDEAKHFIDGITGNEQQRQVDEGTHTVLSPVEEKKATVKLAATVKLEKETVTPEPLSNPPLKGDVKKSKNKGGRPRTSK